MRVNHHKPYYLFIAINNIVVYQHKRHYQRRYDERDLIGVPVDRYRANLCKKDFHLQE
jgi:hypothetical protein